MGNNRRSTVGLSSWTRTGPCEAHSLFQARGEGGEGSLREASKAKLLEVGLDLKVLKGGK